MTEIPETRRDHYIRFTILLRAHHPHFEMMLHGHAVIINKNTKQYLSVIFNIGLHVLDIDTINITNLE